MRNIYKLFLLAFAFVLIQSCSKSEPDSISVSSGAIGTSGVQIPNNNTPTTLSVTANVPWTATLSNNSAGFVVSPLSGQPGTTSITVTAQPNRTNQDKTCDINFMAGTATASITLVQPSLVFAVSPASVVVGPTEGAKVEVELNCNTDWQFDNSSLPQWLSVSPAQGSGKTKVTVTAKENEEKQSREAILRVNYAGSFGSFIVKQEPAPNHAPTKPVISSPQDGAKNLSTVPTVVWNECTDEDGEQVTYTVHYSKNQTEWKKIDVKSNTTCPFMSYNVVLDPKTVYYIKVVATDGNENGEIESDVITVETGEPSAYADGGYTIYMESSKPNPVRLVFIGDGYSAADHVYGGQFDKDLNEGIEGLFSVEPYKTYREYFTVYKLAAYSKESGITITSEGINKNSFYKTVISGGNTTHIECNVASVWAQVQKIPGFTEADLDDSPVCMMLNTNYYAGTCYTSIDGVGSKSVAMCPALRNHQYGVDIPMIVAHEYGGHGFGRLADEYVNYENETIPAANKSNLEAWQSYGWNLNVYATNDKNTAPWSRFFGLPDYSHVGWYAGGHYYGLGVWRSEYISCMWDNRLYYNSQSRYLIVDRIMSIAGEEMTLEKFIQKDVQKTDNTSTSNNTKANYVQKFVPLAPPVMVMNK